MAAGFLVDADEATRLAVDIERKRALLLPKIHAETLKAGRQILALTRAGAPKGPHTATFRTSFWTQTKHSATGTEVSVESKSQLGMIIVFGTSTSGPHDSPGAALAQVDPSWTRAIMDAAADII